MIFFQHQKDDCNVYDYDDVHDDDDAGNDADLNRRLVLVHISPIPSTACDAPLKTCVMGWRGCLAGCPDPLRGSSSPHPLTFDLSITAQSQSPRDFSYVSFNYYCVLRKCLTTMLSKLNQNNSKRKKITEYLAHRKFYVSLRI